jgi:GGDEF domain-containing protein
METMTMSIGEAFDPQDGAGAEQLLAKADRRMYRARQHARIPRPSVAGLETPAYITLQ